MSDIEFKWTISEIAFILPTLMWVYHVAPFLCLKVLFMVLIIYIDNNDPFNGDNKYKYTASDICKMTELSPSFSLLINHISLYQGSVIGTFGLLIILLLPLADLDFA